MMRSVIQAGLLCLLCAEASGQTAEQGLLGSWKYLRAFNYVHVDERDRVFQCRLDTDLNVQFATAIYQAGGVIEWTPVRFFSLYGQEVPSGREWGTNTIELRSRIMFLTVPAANGQGTAREEYDKVATLPTICEHYRQMAFEE
ncbi:MAG: hypothetical protein Q7V56_00655 [Gammaproteobacteria bacterium]|nr:hypothetical protein [Gammaproteobacteria bacterium]